jgi:hypothetical protein
MYSSIIRSNKKLKPKMNSNTSTQRNSDVAKSFLNKKQDPKSPTNIDDITRVVGSYIDEEFDCVYNNFSGKLYAGPSALLFRGRIVLFFEWSVVIRWEDVIQVKKSDSSINVIVKEPKGASHSFEKLFDPDKVWSSLVSLHNDSILDTPGKQATPRANSRTLRRINSDPYAIRALKLFDNTDDDDDDKIGKEIDYKTIPSTTNNDSKQDPEENSTPEEAWSKLMNDSSSYAYAVVEDCELPCALNTFFDLFLADEAKHSIPTFMEADGEEDVNTSAWKKDGLSKSRVIQYTHPVNAPMVPPMARARKEQLYRRYENHGLMLETHTFVEDVPMTDCFFVAEMILVELVGDNKVSISMFLDIRFVKLTMFKSIITRTTKAEVEKSMQDLAKYMSQSFGHDAVTEPKPILRVEQNASNFFQSVASKLVLLMLVILLSSQLWMIRTIQSMQIQISELTVTCSGSGGLQLDSSVLMECYDSR